jgi:cyclomaltodextrinase
MEYSAILHDMDKRFCYAIDKGLFVIRIQVKKDDIKEIILHYMDKYISIEMKDTRKTVPMKKIASSQFHDYYEAQIRMDMICLRYFFEFTDMHGEKAYYGNYEFSKECITNIDRMFDCPQNLREEEMFEVPEWAANKVVYQIFPSRYAASQPVDKELWYKAPITFTDNLHGDIRGIIDHLDYIRDLGIDVIYLTPIFKSDSSHKYDTIDYYQIDPSFGTAEDLRELVQKAHQYGMKVVLDAVFNHTGRDFFAFKDIIENKEKSKYLDWYFIDKFPLDTEPGQAPNFKCFGYYGGMPKLNLKNPEVEKYVTDVACYWLKECDIDGWRMDVGDEISHYFWKHFRRAVKAVKKDALIIGEIWHYAGDFLEGDEWDTVMNYPFYLNLIDLLADEKIGVSRFIQNLGYMKGRLNKKCYPLMWNLIDSHDTARFLHLCNNKQKQHLAAAFQLLMPGMPMIYYGDELAMPGANDPDCRRGMYWDEEYRDNEMLEWYKRLIQVRRTHACIVEGELAETITRDEDGTIVLIRKNTEETIALIFNCSNDTKEFNEYAGQYNLLGESVFDGKVEGYDAAVLLCDSY